MAVPALRIEFVQVPDQRAIDGNVPRVIEFEPPGDDGRQTD